MLRSIFGISYLRAIGNVYFCEWEIAKLGRLALRFAIVIDNYCLAFMFTVRLISRCIYMFSRSYMGHEKFFLRFHLLVLSFVFSIILLIIRPNLVSLLLGWDGLGITSYLLVIYFQRRKAYNAGIITALTNRVGDVLILLSIGILGYMGSWNLYALTHSSIDIFGVVSLISLAALTKRAQIPFSAWLPAAMAAPTPVSALVHSSTLVTAGVYLLFRFQPILRAHRISSVVIFLGCLTIFMAGMAAIVEIDIKKIVALSTLRQLGVIIISIGAGLISVAYFHLLSHAFFKALLFITVGAIIHISRDYQDIRKIRLLRKRCPTTLRFNLRANLSLCGIPFTSGFYSKDRCIELYVGASSVWSLSLIFYLSTALTVAYTARFIIVVFLRSPRSASIIWRNDKDSYMLLSMRGLFPLALIGGSLLLWALFWSEPISSIRILEKNTTIIIILIGATLGTFLRSRSNSSSPTSHTLLWGAIWSLPLISSRIFNLSRLSLRGINRRTCDQLWLPYILVWQLEIKPKKSSLILRGAKWPLIIGLGFIFRLIGRVLLYLHVINLSIYYDFKNRFTRKIK